MKFESGGFESVSSGRTATMLPAAITDIGCERDINEDRYSSVQLDGASVWVVCDGMGGAVGGELAAQLAIETIKRSIESSNGEVGPLELADAIQEANRVIVLRRQNPAFSGMGTTVVSALVTGEEMHVMHAGDSRAYSVGSNGIQQLTVDHTYVQDLVNKGMISEEEALVHPQSHVLTRCLGGELKVSLDIASYSLIPSSELSFLMLCSDGLYSLVDDNEFHEIIFRSSPQEACITLVELARERGGYDNITVAVLPMQYELAEYQPRAKKEGFKKSRVESDLSTFGTRKGISAKQKMVLMIALVLFSIVTTVCALLLAFS